MNLIDETPVSNLVSPKKVTIVEIDPAIAHAQITEMNILHLCGDIARVSLMHSLLKQAKDPEAEGYFTKTELLSLVFKWCIQYGIMYAILTLVTSLTKIDGTV